MRSFINVLAGMQLAFRGGKNYLSELYKKELSTRWSNQVDKLTLTISEFVQCPNLTETPVFCSPISSRADSELLWSELSASCTCNSRAGLLSHDCAVKPVWTISSSPCNKLANRGWSLSERTSSVCDHASWHIFFFDNSCLFSPAKGFSGNIITYMFNNNVISSKMERK